VGKRVFATVALGTAVAAAAFELVPAALGSSHKRADCTEPDITSLGYPEVTYKSAVIAFTIQGSAGEYDAKISSPDAGSFGGSFGDGGGTYSASVGGLLPHTHYRGTLYARNGCGSDAGVIDFRTPEAPACTGPPVIGSLDVGSLTPNSAVVNYTLQSGDETTVQVVVDPGGIDVNGSVSPPGGSGQAPLSGLTPNTTYSVKLVAQNGCGESSGETSFTTAPGCIAAPTVENLEVVDIRERTAVVVYAVHADFTASVLVTVAPAGVSHSWTFDAPGGGARIGLSKLEPARRYSVVVKVGNGCGGATAVKTFHAAARVAVVVAGSGTVTSKPSGISCIRACTGSFPTGSTVRLTARPARGWRFSGWIGACHGHASVCTFRAANNSVRATFRRAPSH
jgi:hypothetical protein